MNIGRVGSGTPREWVTPHKVSLAVLVTVYAEKELTEKYNAMPMSPVLVTGHGPVEESVLPTAWPPPIGGVKTPGDGGTHLGSGTTKTHTTSSTDWSIVVSRNFARAILNWIQV